MAKKRRFYRICFIAAAVIAVTVMMAVIRVKKDSGQLVITMTGDIMLSRGVSKNMQKYGYDYPYEDVGEIFLKDDFTIGNLECPITDSGISQRKKYLFKADQENAAALKKAGFDCLSLANNHTMDYLDEGLLDTMNCLEENSLSFVGASKSGEANSTFIFQKNGIKVGLLAYNALPGDEDSLNEEEAFAAYISTLDGAQLEKDIASLDCDFTIVYFHWGIEYQPYKSESQEQIARRAIDAGADFVAGAHPHVLQDTEVYKGKYIYYSLGNFIFDSQIPPGTDQSIILQLKIDKNGVLEVKEIPVTIKDAKPLLE